MVVLTLDPTKWPDTIESAPECLHSPVSATNVENVLSKTSTRRHQKALFKALEPFVVNMLKDSSGVSILTSLVKYGTIATVNGVAGVIMRSQGNIFEGHEPAAEMCDVSLGFLLERIIYREDCTGESRLSLINTLKSLDYYLLMENSLFVLATARLILLDREFVASFCSSLEAQNAYFQLSSSPTKRILASRFCEIVLSETESREGQPTDLCATFVFTALSSLYEPSSSLRPCKQITSLLASRGSLVVIEKMARHLSAWPDIRTRAQKEDYAKIVALILARLQDTDTGILLVKAIFKLKEDVDERLASRKVSHLQLLAAIAGKAAYVDALTKALGESQAKKLGGAVVLYRNISNPRVFATKAALVDRLKQIRTTSTSSDAMENVSKKRRK